MTGGTAYPLQEQPAYAPVANQVYGTGQDPFNLTLGGYYVSPASLPQYPGEPTHYNAYGEQLLPEYIRLEPSASWLTGGISCHSEVLDAHRHGLKRCLNLRPLQNS